MTAKTPAALFDYDGTLASGDSVLPFVQFIVKRYPKTAAIFLKTAIQLPAYGLGLISKAQMKTKILKLYRHIPESEREKLMQDFHDQVLAPRYFPAGIERVRWHRDQGHTLILASASVDLYLGQVQQALGFHHLICTQTRMSGDTPPLPEITGPNCYGKEKVRRIAATKFFSSTDWPASWAYSDHPSDLPMFLLCGHRVAVSPNKNLNRLARREGWEIVSWT